MNSNVNLSFIITTYQKLPYLKVVLTDLINKRQDDEEIVIVDGGSTDGTAEWLQELYNENKIQKFLTQKDFSEAHGTNRAILLSEGKLLKLLTDDDVYHYEAIRECKLFMLQTPEVDIMGADGFDNYTGGDLIFVRNIDHYRKWVTHKQPFDFYGPGLMFRRSSLPLLGLFNCLTKFLDMEFTYRATGLPVKIAWYTKPIFVRVVNVQSNTIKYMRARKLEKSLNNIYNQIVTGSPAWKLSMQAKINQFKSKAYNLLHHRSSQVKSSNFIKADFRQLFEKYQETLRESHQASNTDSFLYFP